jgi:hypothetical protein
LSAVIEGIISNRSYALYLFFFPLPFVLII